MESRPPSGAPRLLSPGEISGTEAVTASVASAADCAGVDRLPASGAELKLGLGCFAAAFPASGILLGLDPSAARLMACFVSDNCSLEPSATRPKLSEVVVTLGLRCATGFSCSAGPTVPAELAACSTAGLLRGLCAERGLLGSFVAAFMRLPISDRPVSEFAALALTEKPGQMIRR